MFPEYFSTNSRLDFKIQQFKTRPNVPLQCDYLRETNQNGQQKTQQMQ